MKKTISLFTACAIVVANMIGTGVFTSIGFQVASIQHTWSIVILWLLGGILALFGAFAYAELGTHYKESGGDYIYLARIFHPLAGYLSAWTGLTVGFSAPVALAAMAFNKYLTPVGIQGAGAWPAVAIILMIGLMHSFTIRHSSRLQNASTLLKILFVLVLLVMGFYLPGNPNTAIDLGNGWQQELFQPNFAVSMIYVSFAYTGWNAAGYIVGELDKPERNLPLALIGSTLFVTVLYILFQVVLLKNATIDQLAGKEEVTFIAFDNLLGSVGGKWVSIFIAVQLVATISSYLWVGPRVTWALANEYRLWRRLRHKNSHGIPVSATWVHIFLAIAMTITGSFESILLYAGFVLQLMGSITIASSLFLKGREPGLFKSPLKPLLQLIYLLFSGWIMIFTLTNKPVESLGGLLLLMVGTLLYFCDKPVLQNK